MQIHGTDWPLCNGTFLAEFQVGASLSPSHARDGMREEAQAGMKKLIKDLMIVVMLGVVSAGAFAQRKDEEKRPTKEPVKVITNESKDKPPQNSNQPKQDPKKKP